MFPGVSGFQWDAGHIIFLGAFFSVVSVVSAMLVLAWIRSLRDRQPRRAEAIRWHTDFSELPASDRCCRHQLTGEVAHRVCPNEFDCRKCSAHPNFLRAACACGPMAETGTQALIAGIPVPLDRMYHRGHTWARKEPDGTYTVGLDAFAARLLGRSAKFDVPGPGHAVYANGTAWNVREGGDKYRVLSPVSGVIENVAHGEEEWVLKVRPEPAFRTDHLLAGRDVAAWMRNEFERLQIALAPVGSPALADGGTMVDDVPAEYPGLDWADVKARMLLNS